MYTHVDASDIALIVFVASANSSLVNGKDWPRWDPVGYTVTLKTYLKFVHVGFLGKWDLGAIV
jgi:hypothetical protein